MSTTAQRPCLETLPPELVEDISEHMSMPRHVGFFEWENGGSHRHTQDLIAFSQVCTSLRGPVERKLYRDLDLKTHRWMCIGRGCLHLLLRTLEQRPALRQHVRSVYLDWNSCWPLSMGAVQKDAFLELLAYCTSLQRLFVKTFPSNILKDEYPKLLNITEFGTMVFPHAFQTICDRFHGLRTLHLSQYGKINSEFKQPYNHQLKTLRLDGSSLNPSNFFLHAVEACASTVEDLHIRFINKGYNITPITISSLAGANLHILHLDSFSVLASPFTKAALVLQHLPCLEELQIKKCVSVDAEAFNFLPPTLCSLRFPNYRGCFHGGKGEFIKSLCLCLENHSRTVVRLETYGMEDATKSKEKLKLLRNTCVAEGIAIVHTKECYCQPEIRLIFATA